MMIDISGISIISYLGFMSVLVLRELVAYMQSPWARRIQKVCTILLIPFAIAFLFQAIVDIIRIVNSVTA
jgi:Mn2+/Fe2+ NRAMP family transporter